MDQNFVIPILGRDGPIPHFCRYADIDLCRYADIAHTMNAIHVLYCTRYLYRGRVYHMHHKCWLSCFMKAQSIQTIIVFALNAIFFLHFYLFIIIIIFSLWFLWTSVLLTGTSGHCLIYNFRYICFRLYLPELHSICMSQWIHSHILFYQKMVHFLPV